MTNKATEWFKAKKKNDTAPSPSGKAGDFDSPIVGSTPAGATENRLLSSSLGRRFLWFGGMFYPGTGSRLFLNVSFAVTLWRPFFLKRKLWLGRGGRCCAKKIWFRKHSLLLCGVPLLGYPQQRRKSVVMATEYWKIYRIFYLEPLFCVERLTRNCFLQ